MDSFEWNKIAGAVLGTALLVMALSIVSEVIFTQHAPEKPGYVINVPQGGGEGGGNAPPPAAEEPIAVRLAKADVKTGEQQAKACLACHTLMKGEPAKIGPNLYGVVGGPSAHMAGFNYSAGMQQRKADGKNWTFDDLDHFLTNPRGFVQGTAMTFAGIKNPQQRADVIAYLRTLSDNPVPLPPAEAAPAGGGQPAAPPGGQPPAGGGEKPAAPQGAAPTAPQGGQPAAPQGGTPAAPQGAGPAGSAPEGAAPAKPAEPAPAAPAAPAPAPAQ